MRTKPPFPKHFAKYWQLYAMAAIPLVYFVIFKYVPMAGNILAFRKFRAGASPFGVDWIGMKNFQRFLGDKSFWRAFRNTLITSSLNLLFNFPVPIIFALLLNELRRLKFKKLVQTVSYMPRFISTIVMITMLNEILSPTSGILNMILKNTFGMKPVYFTNDPRYFRTLYILTDMWQFTGWNAIIYLAAITGINSELYESAMIDGANRWHQTLYITIPSILPTIMVMLILSVGRLLSVGFEKVLLLYTPDNSIVSDVIDTFVYRYGIVNNNYSYATAVGLFGGVIGVILVSSANLVSRRVTGDGLY
ncbi:sugar ABC transporter permease [Clostridia bacterium]|nr:sugar ABC transporter permease [Clostridia bacterium]